MEFVYFGGVDWGYTWQRPQQLATRLAPAGRLLYVNPLGLRAPRWGDLARLAGRLRGGRGRRPGPAPPPGITVESLWWYLPLPDSATAARMNAARLARMVRRWRPSPAGPDLVIWAGTPAPAILPLVDALPGARLVYDCLDDFAAFHADAARVAETEARLAGRAALVFATSAALHDRMRRWNPRTIRLPNAGDWEHFAPARAARLPVPSDMVALPAPVLGYVGEIARWFDADLVGRLARAEPRWQIVLVGPADRARLSSLLDRPNVHYLGPRPYAELPAYLHRFDVCLLPFRLDRLTAAVDPVKLYEYLAAGKPVVSTPLPEAGRHGEVVDIAEAAAFPAAVAAALQHADDPARIARRLAVARDNGWDRRAAEALRLLATDTMAPAAPEPAEPAVPAGGAGPPPRPRAG